MDSIYELEDTLVGLITKRKDSGLKDLRQYHQALADLDREVLELIFRNSSEKRANRKKSTLGYAEKMGLLFAKYPNAYKPWDKSQDAKLTELHNGRKTTSEISEIMQRQEGGIRSRLKRLGLINGKSYQK